MGRWSWLKRLGRFEYGRGFGDPGGLSEDQPALIEIDLDHKKRAEQDEDDDPGRSREQDGSEQVE
jgi:hypothetical protein